MENKRSKLGREPSDQAVWEAEEITSATECTGLVPAAIQTKEEAESYTGLYAIHQQKPAREREAHEKPVHRKKKQ